MDNIVTEIFFNPNSKTEWTNYVKENISNKLATKFNNIFPNNLPISFQEFGQKIIDAFRLEPNKLCKGLKFERINQTLLNSDAILVVLTNNKVIGFATLKFLGDSQILYIDVICANLDHKGIGSLMMDLITLIAENSSLSEIKLDSVTNAVGFYLKKGFSCDKLCKMKKSVNSITSFAYGYGGKRKTKQNKLKHYRVKKYKKHKKTRKY